jgi:hypothetical protein
MPAGRDALKRVGLATAMTDALEEIGELARTSRHELQASSAALS